MDITILRQKRKTISIQVNEDLTVTVKVPRSTSDREIQRILAEKRPWIEKHTEKIRKVKEEQEKNPAPKLSAADIRALADQAMQYIPERVAYFAGIMGVTYGRITIRNQRTLWGSCTSRGNLNFNCLLMLAPADVIDYVVVHELCHRKEMNHSAAFWAEVEKVLPDYKARLAWLKANGSAIMKYIPRRDPFVCK